MEFKVGDKVKCVSAVPPLVVGDVYTIKHVDFLMELEELPFHWYSDHRFEHTRDHFYPGDKVKFKAKGAFHVYEVVQTTDGLGIEGPESGREYAVLDWDELELVERTEEIDRTNPPTCDSMPPLYVGGTVEYYSDVNFQPVRGFMGDVVSVTLDGKTYKAGPGAKLHVGPAEFKAGDKVRVKTAEHETAELKLDTDYTVKTTRNVEHGLCLVLEEFSDWVTGFYAWRFEHAPAAPTFTRGDKVRVKPEYQCGQLALDTDYTIKSTRESRSGETCLLLEEFPYAFNGFYAYRFKHAPAPSLTAAIDKRAIEQTLAWREAGVITEAERARLLGGNWDVEAAFAPGPELDAAVKQAHDRLPSYGDKCDPSKTMCVPPGHSYKCPERKRALDPEFKRALDQLLEVQETLKDQPSQALRFNSDKPESDYILTYAGGIEAVFSPEFDYFETLYSLVDVYAFQEPQHAADALLAALRAEADDCGDDIVHLLADTQVKGAKKYEQGNYLKGANWRQYFQAAVRHAQHLQNGDEHDQEGFSHRGNFFFNVLMLHHAITTGIGTDDRVKVPT